MKRTEPGWSVLALAGIAALIGSFLPFYTFGGDVDLTVWSRSLFPTAALVPLIVFGLGIQAAFVVLMGYEPRSPFLNFTWVQARLAGAAFAIVLSLSYLVQGRAGGNIGSGWIIMFLSTLASFAGGVMTRRAQIARGQEEILPAEHPWRAAVLRWRGELAERLKPVPDAVAGDGDSQPTPVAPIAPVAQTEPAPKEDEKPEEKPVEKSVEKSVEKVDEKPTPIPRLSAVQTEPGKEEKKPAPARRKPAKKAAAKKKAVSKAVKQTSADTADDTRQATDVDTAGDAPQVTDADTAGDAPPAKDGEAKAEARAEAKAEANAEDDGEERESPAAPG